MSLATSCVAILAFLCLATAFNVSLARAKTSTVYGFTIDPTDALYKAQRAHGNTVEYAPILALLIYILGQGEQPTWVIATMVAVTFCRVLLVAGLLIPESMERPNPMRFIGSLGTYIGGFTLIAALLI